MKKYMVLGVMSGSSMDGIDMALCEFELKKNQWTYKIIHTQTTPYSCSEMELLKSMHHLPSDRFIEADRQISKIYAEKIIDFLSTYRTTPQLIGFHGHTVFHNPFRGYTYQAGHGGIIASLTRIPVVSDFRSQDVALGGEGAPLVPLGDEIFFSEYDAVLNLGGIANVSFKEGGVRKGFDIVPVNQVFNYLANYKGLPYDFDGKLAQSGILIPELLIDILKINKLKNESLGREFVESFWIPLLTKYTNIAPIENILRTVAEAIAEILSQKLKNFRNILVTGGGAYNLFLIKLIQEKIPKTQIFIPNEQIIQFKEALIFAFLALLRFLNKENTLTSVTGANRPCIAGALWMP
ncbi:MAG: anhydro-N-acetylmuramic acid kinase [Bacteroidales bacterium]|nr:anhydro-N-acetylmuramic acid kinase [Bacteroidales bacterium]